MKTPVSVIAFVVLYLLFPASALAEAGVTNPVGKSAWDLYVYGNGSVIFATMNGIKMLMVPDAGNSGFDILLLLLATLGFLVLAIGAGFDPGKNLIRMFTYILVVWGVSFGSTKLTTNINIIDMVGSEAGSERVYTVSGVPALVGLPAALVSQVGRYFTEVMETYFDYPAEFKMTAGAAGQFNLFAKMLDDTTKFRLADPNLRQSISAYTANCVIPAMARGVFGYCKDRTDNCARDSNVWVAGREALTSAPSYLELLASARHNSIMTTYWPARAEGETESAWLGRIQNTALRAQLQSGDDLTITAARARQMGVIMSCNEAFLLIAYDAEAHAEDLYNGSAQAWARTGTQVPFEQAFQTMMANTAAPGSQFAGFSRPSGYILQQAMINSSAGTFRAAAAQTGNSEVMQAAALAQAEAQQRSTWVASFHMFNNMMGYVYSVLQAFIFAITPIVVVALMVPGLGKGIFTNYAQILIWLTLWMPMLALINFMITMFAVDSVQGITVFSNGAITAENNGQISERINNLIVAAQFLGTMTPLITWGLVKGTLAFTEFISQGVGSAFASQAGAAAATGNMSMNNMSMDNTTMSKFSTQMSSSVGFGTVSAPMNAAAMSLTANTGGGQVTTGENSGVQLASQLSSRASRTAQELRQSAESFSKSEGTDTSWSSLMREAYSKTSGAARDIALANIVSVMRSAGISDSDIMAVAASADKSVDQSKSVESSNAQAVKWGVNGGFSGGVGKILGVGADIGVSGTTGDRSQFGHGTAEREAAQRRAERSGGASEGQTTAEGETLSQNRSQKLSDDYVKSVDQSHSEAMKEARSRAVSAMQQQSEVLARQAEAAQSMSVSRDVDMLMLKQLERQLDEFESRIPSDAAMTGRIAADTQGLRQDVEQGIGHYQATREDTEAAIASGRRASQAAPDPAATRAAAAEVRGKVAQRREDATRQREQTERKVESDSRVIARNAETATHTFSRGVADADEVQKERQGRAPANNPQNPVEALRPRRRE